jgi:hypothetical protein
MNYFFVANARRNHIKKHFSHCERTPAPHCVQGEAKQSQDILPSVKISWSPTGKPVLPCRNACLRRSGFVQAGVMAHRLGFLRRRMKSGMVKNVD